jgi:hypothetical protein
MDIRFSVAVHVYYLSNHAPHVPAGQGLKQSWVFPVIIYSAFHQQFSFVGLFSYSFLIFKLWKNKNFGCFLRLVKIMDELRGKCPWDKKQTIESLGNLTIRRAMNWPILLMIIAGSIYKRRAGRFNAACFSYRSEPNSSSLLLPSAQWYL